MTSSYIGELGPFRKTNRSAFVNFLHSKYEMYTGAVEVESRPSYLTLDVADICQLRCPTCPTGIENEARRSGVAEPVRFRKSRGLLSQDLFDAVMDELGEYLFLLVLYDWGEPLLNKKLPAFIRAAHARKIETEINTNLSLPLTDEFIEELLGSGLEYIEASIDGFTQASYEAHRQGGDVALVKKNLERLARAREKMGVQTSITYNFLVFSFNEHEIEAARSYADDIGVHFNTRDAFTDNEDWLPSYRRNEKPRFSDKELVQLRVPGQPEPLYARWSPLGDARRSWSAPACGWHYGYSVVTAEGAVQPCCAVAHEDEDFGVVKPGSSSFASVWNNARYRAARASAAGIRLSPGERSICTRCYFPSLMRHMYSLHDMKVIAQFERVFGGREPGLAKAFHLLADARYGAQVGATYRRGEFPPEVLASMLYGREREMVEFTDYFRDHLLGREPARPRALSADEDFA